MEWKVHKKDNTSTTINKDTLLEFLVGRIMDDEKEDFITLAATFSTFLQDRGTLGQFIWINSSQLH